MHIEQTISWTAVAAIIVFGLGQLSTILYRVLEARRERMHFAEAICADLNRVISLSGEASSVDRFNSFVDKCSIDILNSYAIPLYKAPPLDANVEKISILPAHIIEEVVHAYGYMARMNALIEHFKSKEFLSAPYYVHESMKEILKKTNSEFLEKSKKAIELLGKYRNKK